MKRLLAAAGALAALAVTGCGASSPTVTSKVIPTATAAQGKGIVGRGAKLYEEDGCEGCHSLNGTRMTGPSWKGLAGSTVHLANGRTLVASNAYLKDHILDPNAWTVKGYPGEVMAAAIEELHLAKHPQDVAALVAFIDSLRG
ncbi:MAG TPA: c-type cytochrome [Solirubrobacteraceae bacterium]|nr:c-type cytochrome [Solirubrobacteraceae bacterium]